jgi:hypothetical protein
MELAEHAFELELAQLGGVVEVEHQPGVVAAQSDSVDTVRRKV